MKILKDKLQHIRNRPPKPEKVYEQISDKRAWGIAMLTVGGTIEMGAAMVEYQFPRIWPAAMTMAAVGGVALVASIENLRQDYQNSRSAPVCVQAQTAPITINLE